MDVLIDEDQIKLTIILNEFYGEMSMLWIKNKRRFKLGAKK